MGRWKEIKHDMHEFWLLTSMKGIPRVYKARFTCTTGLWVAAVVIFFGISLYQTYALVSNFLEYGTVTIIHEYSLVDMIRSGHELSGHDKHEAVLDSSLSAITLCNNNMMPSNVYLHEYADYLERVEKEFPGNKTIGHIKSAGGFYRSTPRWNLTEIGFRRENFVVDCQYTLMDELGGIHVPCEDISEIVVFNTIKFFNCFTYKLIASKVPEKSIPVSISGVLYLDDMEVRYSHESMHFSKPLGELSSGAFVIFHRVTEKPDVDYAIALPPGFESIVRTKQTLRHKESHPFGKCKMPTIKYYDLEDNEYDYSLESCFYNCLFEEIAETCSCIEPWYAVLSSPKQYPYMPLCGAFGNDSTNSRLDFICQKETSDKLWPSCLERCPSRCEEIYTVASTSLLKWPKKGNQIELYEDLIRGKSWDGYFDEYRDIADQLRSKNISNSQASKMVKSLGLDLIEDNFVKFTINGNKESVTVIQDMPQMTATDLLSQLGGALNLFSGITAFLFIELLELVIHLVVSILSGGKKVESNNVV